MADFRPGTPEQESFLAELVDAGHLIATRVPGLYGRGGDFEQVRTGIADMVTAAVAAEQPRRMSFPPLLPKYDLETIGYLKNFPHLAGTIFSFDGNEAQALEQQQLAERHEDWSGLQSMTDLVLTPAACYPVYPAVGAGDAVPAAGITVDAGSAYVFRHEPSGDPARLQMFHQRELVRIGAPETVAAWRDDWRDRALELLRGLGLEAELEVANDPFFGRSGRMLAASQREQELKFEITVPIAGPEPTAVASFNYHQSHFSDAHTITMEDGSVAHTACLGFGLERITLALLRRHGVELAGWPDAIRARLGIA